MVSFCTCFPFFTVVSSLIRRPLELQDIHHLVVPIARESGRLCPKMTSSDGSFSSSISSSSRCWLVLSLLRACFSSRFFAMSSSASSSMVVSYQCSSPSTVCAVACLCHLPGLQDFYSLHHEWRWPHRSWAPPACQPPPR